MEEIHTARLLLRPCTPAEEEGLVQEAGEVDLGDGDDLEYALTREEWEDRTGHRLFPISPTGRE